MLIDTHSHVNFNTFRDDADSIIQETLLNKTWMVVVGSNYKTSKRALDYANKYEKGVYAAVGLHPTHLFDMQVSENDYDYSTTKEDFNYSVYEKLAKFEKVVAIGEIGLDYYHLDTSKNIQEIKKVQKDAFLNQLILARNLDLPVIIHSRQAEDDTLNLLKEFKKEYKKLIPKNKPWGVLHCYSGGEDLAWKYFDLGLIVSFTGIITFSKQWDDLIRKIPNDKYMIETDCPFLTPEPYRGKRNEPMLVYYVAKRIADIKSIEIEKVAEYTTRNAKKFFNI